MTSSRSARTIELVSKELVDQEAERAAARAEKQILLDGRKAQLLTGTAGEIIAYDAKVSTAAAREDIAGAKIEALEAELQDVESVAVAKRQAKNLARVRALEVEAREIGAAYVLHADSLRALLSRLAQIESENDALSADLPPGEPRVDLNAWRNEGQTIYVGPLTRDVKLPRLRAGDDNNFWPVRYAG